MAFSTKPVLSIRNLHLICCQSGNDKPSTSHRLNLHQPPPRTPSAPPLNHHHRKPTPSITINRPPDSEPSPLRRRNTAGSTSDILRLFHGLSLPLLPDLYVSLVKECTTKRDSASALRLHADFFAHPTGDGPDLPLLNRLLLMHVSCGHFGIARQLFDEMPVGDRHAISWAILVTAYSHDSQYEETLSLFLQMLRHGHQLLLEFPKVAMVSVLKACMYTENKELGKQLHSFLLKLSPSFAHDEIPLGASLADLYVNLAAAESVNHDHLPPQSVWETRIENDYQEGRFAEVIEDFKQMGSKGICREGVLCTVMRACSKTDDGGITARQVHAFAIKLKGGLDGKVGIQCGLIKMYGECGLVHDSERVFETITDKRCGAHWNAMLMCYLHNGVYVEAFKLLYKMKAAAVEVTESLVNKVRIACGTGTSTH